MACIQQLLTALQKSQENQNVVTIAAEHKGFIYEIESLGVITADGAEVTLDGKKMPGASVAIFRTADSPIHKQLCTFQNNGFEIIA